MFGQNHFFAPQIADWDAAEDFGAYDDFSESGSAAPESPLLAIRYGLRSPTFAHRVAAVRNFAALLPAALVEGNAFVAALNAADPCEDAFFVQTTKDAVEFLTNVLIAGDVWLVENAEKMTSIGYFFKALGRAVETAKDKEILEERLERESLVNSRLMGENSLLYANEFRSLQEMGTSSSRIKALKEEIASLDDKFFEARLLLTETKRRLADTEHRLLAVEDDRNKLHLMVETVRSEAAHYKEIAEAETAAATESKSKADDSEAKFQQLKDNRIAIIKCYNCAMLALNEAMTELGPRAGESTQNSRDRASEIWAAAEALVEEQSKKQESKK